jgi:flagellar biosynthesis component FlhA
MFGKVPLKISSITTQITTTTYDLSYAPETLVVTSVLDGVVGQVSIPVSSTASGAIINVETVLCNVTIERWVR